MKLATTSRTAITVDIDQHLLADKVLGQRLTPWDTRNRGSILVSVSVALPDPGDITFQVFKRQRQLIGIKPLGASAELGALQLPNDLLQAVDLAVAVIENGGHVAHQLVQQSRVGRQIIKVEPHVQYYM
jgi:hypothetical protein